MAEKSERDRQWSYAANSNLVLRAERDGNVSREASGEVMTLNGRVNSMKMGERSLVDQKNNTELTEAIRRKIPIIKRGEMLASIVSIMKNIVVVG